MTLEVPELYFRLRENGAAVFRVDKENRMRRLDMEQIAVVNVRNGEIKVHGQQVLTNSETAQIRDWLEARQTELAQREIEEVKRTIEQLNLTTTWLQQKATDEDVAAVSNELLMAIHDLRSVLVRKSSNQLSKTKNKVSSV